jgi:hypothetical protein
MLQPKRENCMCVIVLQFAKATCGLALARKSSHNPTNPKMPLITISQKMAARSEGAPEGREWSSERKVMPYLLELLDSTLVDTTALVDQVCNPL